jgi:beta-mannosidase
MTTLVGKPEATRAALEALRDAGANMVRVGGTMFYEDDTFYTACDELGLLVWQDFMFANMDYPVADEAFCASVRREADGFCSRTQLSPSIAVFCGNSDGEQQAAMLGLERELWSSTIFSELLPSVVSARRPDVPYWPSSASGGALPFHPDTGTSSYYGVGAYLRDLDDARRSRLRFASECLAFANVPCDETIELVVGQGQSPFHHPKWKERVPRDSGPGWDFEDVRDHYVQRFFNVDPMRLRYADMDRYLALSRVAAGHAMEATFHEWRRAGSDCGGALIWFHRDLWAGPGWGIMDSSGRPKAAYFHLKRAWKPVCLVATDEGLNGITLHAINESPRALRVELNLTLYRHGHMQTAIGKMQLELTGRSTLAVPSDVLLGRFLDTTYAYRFGPPGHDVAHAVMTDVDTGARLGEAFHFPLGLGAFSETEVGLEATASPPAEDGSVQLSVRAHRFAQSVAIDARGYVPSDDFFHLAPSDARTITLRPVSGRPRFSGFVRALNDRGAVRIGIAGGPS